MQKIQDFLEKNKAILAVVAIAAAVGVGAKLLSQDKPHTAPILDASIQKVPLIERLGGDLSVSAITSRFFDLIVNDKQFKQHFLAVDKSKLKVKFTAVLKHLFGGPAPTVASNLSQCHAKFNISEQQFEIIQKLLEKSLLELGVDNKEIQDAQLALTSIKSEIVTLNKSA